jgi:hypothetical protein
MIDYGITTADYVAGLTEEIADAKKSGDKARAAAAEVELKNAQGSPSETVPAQS